MSVKREVEIKHPLKNPQDVILRLKELGASIGKVSQQQEDVYFVPAHRNFLDEKIVSEWLRIRSTEHEVSINYKRWLPIGEESQTHCDEYETIVKDADALVAILKALDMTEIVRVKKIRSTWDLQDVEIAIDQVDGLGCFIELEAKQTNEDIGDIHIKLRKILSELQADVLPQDRRGYPYQLLKRDK